MQFRGCRRATKLRRFLKSFALMTVLGVSILPGGPAAAKVKEVNKALTGRLSVFIKGKITHNDYRELRDLAARLTSDMTFYIYFDSEGGSVDAAMEIGRFIRQYGGRTFVLSDNKCLSACFLAFLGGYSKDTPGPDRNVLLNGKIGVHGCKFDISESQNYNREDIMKIWRSAVEMSSKLTQYLIDMEINGEFIDKIIAKPETEMSMLGYKDFKDLNIVSDDRSRGWQRKIQEEAERSDGSSDSYKQ